MATQSLYRRYRPRRFSELKGQDHIVRALRTSVAEGREGQAYLFSGPRGTGKTTTARIMAKVLNCQNPTDGEPCCECDSCLSVEAGTSYDVHELDAASNNGVDAMRDLIEKASLGTPGRHKVYILDEVHMLSKGAEAALLKTLEEPPPHVVFVLATTDPQKMSDTIRSRTQHLQFHLLAPDTLQDHVRWVAEDAGLTVTDEAIEQVVAQGAGSPRDTLSFLELASNSGGAASEVVALDDFVEAMIDDDPGRALKMVAHAISRGRDPRTVTEELIAFMRNGFLALMAPELVQLPSQRIGALTDLARRLGAPGLVRGIETLGEALTEMRQAPDPRVLLDVATVQLTSPQVSGSDVAALAARIQQLERKLADGLPAAPAATAPPLDDRTAAPPAPTERSSAESATPTGAPSAAPLRAKLGSRAAASPSPTPTQPDLDSMPASEPISGKPANDHVATAASAPGPRAVASPGESADADQTAPAAGSSIASSADWDAVRPQLRGMARAVYSPATFVTASAGSVTLSAPNDAHRAKCEQHRQAVESALGAHLGSAVAVELVVEGGGASPSSPRSPDAPPAGAPPAPRPAEPAEVTSPTVSSSQPGTGTATSSSTGRRSADEAHTARSPMSTTGALAHDMVTDVEPSSPAPLTVVAPIEVEPVVDERNEPAVNGRAIADHARTRGPDEDPEIGLRRMVDSLPADDDVDLDDLVDAPPETVQTPEQRLGEAFPGSVFVDDPY